MKESQPSLWDMASQLCVYRFIVWQICICQKEPHGAVIIYGLKPEGWVDLELCPRVWYNPDTNRGL